jgi:hypothetical protein
MRESVYRSIHIFLTSVLAGGELSALRPGRFTPGEKASGTHLIGGWESPRASLDDMESENSCPYRDSDSDPSIIQPVVSHYTDWAVVYLLELGLQFWNWYIRADGMTEGALSLQT